MSSAEVEALLNMLANEPPVLLPTHHPALNAIQAA